MGSSAFLKKLANNKRDSGMDAKGRRKQDIPDSLDHGLPTAGHQTKRRAVAKATPSLPSRKTVKLNTAHGGRGGRNDQRMAQLMKRKGEDEKTRLYRTHDKLLNPEERVTKYRLAAADETLDAATRRRAAKRGMKVEGESILGMQPNRKGGFTPKQMKRLQTAEKKQTEYQKQLRGASFAAGLLDSMSGDIKDIAVKASGSKALQKRNAALKEQMEETKAQHKGAALAGAFTGEMAKAGAGYMTVGKAAESMLLRGAGKMTGATAPDAIQKAAARVIFDPKRKKMAQVGLRLLGQQAADTAVNTPITLAAGLAEGKSKEEIGKDIGKQMALDAAFNVGLEGVGAAGKKLLTARQAAAERKAKQAAEAVEKPKNNLTREKEVAEGIQETFPDMPPAKEKQALPPADERKVIAEKMKTPRAVTKSNKKMETAKKQAEKSLNHLFYISGREDKKEVKTLLEGVLEEASNGKISAETRDNLFHSLFQKGKMNDPHERNEALGKELREKVIRISEQDAANIPDFGKWKKQNFGRLKHVSVAKIGNLEDVWKELQQKYSFDLFPDEIILPSERLERIAEIAEAQTKRKISLEDGLSQWEKDGTREDFDTTLDEFENAIQAAAQLKRKRTDTIDAAAEIMAQGRNIMERRLSRKEIRGLEKELHQLENDSYVLEELKRVDAESGGDPAAVRVAKAQMETRREEIAQKLIAQEGKRTPDTIREDAATELEAIFRIENPKWQDGLRRALTDFQKHGDSAKFRNALFDELYRIRGKDGSETEKILAKIRSHQIMIGSDAAADIPDINEWNRQLKGLLGKIKVGKESNVEELYDALHEMNPGYFPASIDNPAEQLEQIRMVAERAQENAAMTKDEYKKMFDRTMGRMQDSLDVQKAYAGKVAKQAGQVRSNLLGKVDYGTVSSEEVQGWHREAYRLQQAADSVPNDLNETEKQILEGLLNGDITEETARKIVGPRYALLEQRFQLEQPLRAVQKKIQEQKNYVHQKKYEQIAEIFGEIHIGEGKKGVWKDKHTGIQYGRETIERNIYDIAPDKGTAERIIGGIVQPIHDAERQRFLFIGGYKQKLRELHIDTNNNIALRLPEFGGKKVSESALVQWLGENRFQLKQMQDAGGNPEAYRELSQKITMVEDALTPEQRQRIDEGISVLQGIYKEIHPMINEVLIRNGYDPIGYIEGYFPHMDFDDPNGGMELAAKVLGFDFSSKELPMDIAGRTETFRPGKKWSGNLLERKGTETDYDALRAFDQYIDNIGDVLYHTENIQSLRAAEDYIRYSLSEDSVKQAVDKVRMDISIPYLERQKKIEEIYEENKQNHKLQNFVNYLRTYTDLLAGKKHPLDRGLETQVIGRKVYKVLNELENRVAGNMVGGNIASAMTNFIPITQAIGSMHPSNGLRGMGEAMAYLAKGKKMDDLTKQSAFLTTRKNIDPLYRTRLQKFSQAVGSPMEIADTFTTQAVWRGRFYENMGKGMDSGRAVQEADEFCRGLFGGRSKGAMPTFLQSKAWKPFTMFQLEVNNQLSYLLKDIPREAQGSLRKMFGRYAGIVIGAYVYNDIYEKITGRRSALDPFGMANQTIGNLTGERLRNTADIATDMVQRGRLQLTEETEKKKPSQALTALSEEIGGNLPFVGGLLFDGGRIPIQSALPSVTKIAGALGDMQSGDMTVERGKQTIGRELLKPAAYLLPPTGGGQIRKTVQGLKTMQEGGSYNYGNEGPELEYAVDQENKANWVKSALFGKWSTPEAKSYSEKKTGELGAKQTKAYENMVQAGAKNIVAFEAIDRVRQKETAAERRQAIRYNNKLTAEQKAILYRDVVLEDDDDKDRLILAYCEKNGDFAEGADCLSRMADNESILRKRNVLRQAKLSEATKEHILFQKIVDKDNRKKERDRLALLKNQGLKVEDYLSIKNKYGELYDSKQKTEAKADEMSQWIWEQGYNQQEAAVIKDQFPFWGMYKQKYK